jgi:hypothetical protein
VPAEREQCRGRETATRLKLMGRSRNLLRNAQTLKTVTNLSKTIIDHPPSLVVRRAPRTPIQPKRDANAGNAEGHPLGASPGKVELDPPSAASSSGPATEQPIR